MENKTQSQKSYSLNAQEERLSKMMKAMGHPARMQIMRYLSDNPQCITGDIVQVVPQAQATVSQHLKVLRDVGLICGTVDGSAVNYCIDDDNLAWFKAQVEQLL